MKIGDKIKYITIISDEIYIKDNKKYLLCECKCGNKKYISKETLRTKRIRDCGCGNYMIEKHIGEKYGTFTVIDCFRKRIREKINVVAKCKCECGEIREIVASNLKQVKSCGCLQKFKKEKYIGNIYNDIKILDFINIKKRKIKCLCKCGNEFECFLDDLVSKKRYIIGCEKCKEKISPKSKSLFLWNTKIKINRIKSIYLKMLDRCNNILAKDYKWYGAKGITVCDEWKNDYFAFEKWSLENGYQDNLSIDRINSDGNYEPNNCRWVNMIIQQNNKKNNKKYVYKNKMMTIPEICRLENLNVHTISSRMKTGKYTIYEAINVPIKRR